jgi:hypothetical protein
LQDQFKQAVATTMAPDAMTGAAAKPAPDAAEQASKARTGKPKDDKV